MENETAEIKEEAINLEDIGIGEDKPQVEAKRVLIENYKIEDVKFGSEASKKLVLQVKHPDIADGQIEISGVKYEFGEKIKIAGLWLKLDSDGQIPYNSGTGHFLRFLKIGKISEVKGEQIDTATDDKGYLVVKAY